MSDDDETPPPPKKLFGRPWPKGVSGNPGGRPKTPPEIRAALRDPELIDLFVKNLRQGLLDGDREWTALFGKHVLPAEKDVEVSGKLETSPAAALSTEQLLKLAKKG